MSDSTSTSPRWSTTAKIVVGLFGAGIIAALLFRFQNILAPLLMAFLLAYLLHPLASLLNRKLHIPWRVVSTILFILLFLIIIGLLTWGGISIVDQIQNLIAYLQDLWGDLPSFVAEISSKPLKVGPFSFDLSRFNTDDLWTELQGIVQPILSNLGNVIGSIASGVGSTVTWIIFILLIGYFIMSESNGVRESMIKLNIPTYQADISKLGTLLSNIWNAFLRGQLIVFLITVVVYSIILSILGVRYFFLLALLAGLARFVPYVGPFVAWTTYGLVSLFQTNYFHLAPFPFALIVVGCAWVTDMIMDNYISPRVMSNALKVHPAGVLVMVLISGSLFGFIGILLAAPTLASLKLLSTYILRKLMDMDPWEGLSMFPPAEPWSAVFGRIKDRLAKIFRIKPKAKASIQLAEQTKNTKTNHNPN